MCREMVEFVSPNRWQGIAEELTPGTRGTEYAFEDVRRTESSVVGVWGPRIEARKTLRNKVKMSDVERMCCVLIAAAIASVAFCWWRAK